MMWLALMFGCAQGPLVSGVGPDEVSGGDRLVIDGERLRDGMSVRLESADAEPLTLAVERVSRERLEALLPPRVRPGSWQVVVEGVAGEPVASLPLHVVAPREEPACLDEYTANTEVSLVRSEIVIDRYYRSGDKEKLRFALSDITRVEFERAEHADGPCSAVYLRTTDGRRVVFGDDRKVDLYDRAHRVAQAMGKSIHVVGAPDAAAMGDDSP